MTHRFAVKNFKERFAIMKVGISGYEGEVELWDIPKGCKPTFCHIMVRIAAEHQRALEKKEVNTETYPFRQYPFLLNRGAQTVFDYYFDTQSPIDIFFIPVKTEIDDWEFGFPEPSRIVWDIGGDYSTIVIIDGNEYKIPESMRLGDSSSRNQVLLINNFQYFEERCSVALDFSKAHCRNISTDKPIEKFLSGRSSFGVFENQSEADECRSQNVSVVATAQLEYPYYGYTKVTSPQNMEINQCE